MAVLVDTNILAYVLSGWSDKSVAAARALQAARGRGALVVNVVVLAELAAAPDYSEELVQPWLTLFEFHDIPQSAASLAGRAHRQHRDRGGKRERVLADFLLGAHAQVAGFALLTADPRPYRRYFPKVSLILPDA